MDKCQQTAGGPEARGLCVVHMVAIAANVGRLPPAKGTRVRIPLGVSFTTKEARTQEG